MKRQFFFVLEKDFFGIIVIMKRIDAILLMAFEKKASDVHISFGSPLFVRSFGSLVPLECPDHSPYDTESLLLEILGARQKSLLASGKDVDFSYEIPGKVRCRGNIFRQARGGLDASFRLIPYQIPSREDLSLPDVIDRFIDLRDGLVLVTGPAGSGKTTTLSVIIDMINQKHSRHIITIEDPVEYLFTSKRSVINQREVGVHAQSFEHALRAAIREDPDVIMIGELRDSEAVSMALRCAETGYLVFGTLHTKDAPSTITRIIDIFPPDEQAQVRTILSENIRGILSQMLFPHADGTGMALASEVLIQTSALANLIREDKTFNIPSIIQTGKELGMRSMKDSILDLVEKGLIARKEAASGPEPEEQDEH